MIYGYARVSTTKQMKNGNSIADQEQALRNAGAEIIVTDDFTGTKMDRPNFTELLKELKSGDTLIVTKLDRFARTVVEGIGAILRRSLRTQRHDTAYPNRLSAVGSHPHSSLCCVR